MDDAVLEDLYEKDVVEPAATEVLNVDSSSTSVLSNITQESGSGIQILHVESIPSSGDHFRMSSSSSSDSSEWELVDSASKRRRKSPQVALNTDVEFPDDHIFQTPDDILTSILKASAPNAKPLANPNNEKEMLIRIENVKNMSNPNIDLINKAAFLRVSVDFMIEELGLRPLHYSSNYSLANLKAQYVRNKNASKQ